MHSYLLPKNNEKPLPKDVGLGPFVSLEFESNFIDIKNSTDLSFNDELGVFCSESANTCDLGPLNSNIQGVQKLLINLVFLFGIHDYLPELLKIIK